VAEPSAGDRALATALFQEGRALLSEGRTAEACPKLEESHRLDPSGGTILNLALCDEQAGLLARSWSEFHEAISFARRDGRSDREQAAQSHVLALEPRLSRLTIVVPESVRLLGLQILRDGRELGQASWSTAMPVDGGEHVVRALAPGQEPFTTTVVIAKESDTQTVEIPPFVATLLPPVAPLPRGVAPLIQAATAPEESAPPAGSTRRTIAWALGAGGLVQWGLAGYFGLQAFHQHAESNSECPGDQCTLRGVELDDRAGRAADTATVLALSGLATLAASAYLLLTSQKAGGDARASRWMIESSGATLVLQSRF
jgi:hypothetical protein